MGFGALRRIGFRGSEGEAAARTAIAALGIAAMDRMHAEGFELRSRCFLVAEGPPVIEVLERDGGIRGVESIDAMALMEEAAAKAREEGPLAGPKRICASSLPKSC